MFSLRSNSIESRFTRFLGQFFGFCFREFGKSKSNSEFASLMSFFLASLGLDSIFCM